MEENRDKIFDQRGELCNTIKDLFKILANVKTFYLYLEKMKVIVWIGE